MHAQHAYNPMLILIGTSVLTVHAVSSDSLCSKPISCLHRQLSPVALQAPDAMDCQQGHILLAFAPTRLLQVRAVIHGTVRANHVPTATLTPVRELHLMSPARPLVAAGLVINRVLPVGVSSLTELHQSLTSERAGASLSRPQPNRRGTLSPTQSGVLAGSYSLHSNSGMRGSRMLSGTDDLDSDMQRLSGSWENPGEDWRSIAPMHCLLLIRAP